MIMMKLAIYTQPTDSYGILVIVDNLIRVAVNNGIPARHIIQLSDAEEGELVIPYGPLETKEMIDDGKSPIISLLVDAISLGARNKLTHYIRVGHIFHKDFWGTIPRYIKWYFLDRNIAKNVRNIMLVSKTDGEYLKRYNKNLNIIICPNGCSNVKIKPHTKSPKYRLGILSSWATENTFEENNWFIKKYFLKYAKDNPDVELILAGRGQLLKRLNNQPQVRVLGEISDLADFFSNIDVFIAANPKGCGILNRCLDAFAYKVPVIGNSGAFSGFRYMEDSYLVFNNYKEFVKQADALKNNSELRLSLANNAIQAMQEYNDWDKNYTQLLDQIKMIAF